MNREVIYQIFSLILFSDPTDSPLYAHAMVIVVCNVALYRHLVFVMLYEQHSMNNITINIMIKSKILNI